MKKPYVLITGAYGGLGKALSRSFARRGYHLVLMGRNEEKLKAAAREISGVKVVTLSADLRFREQVEEVINRLHEQGISVSVLINNAGITYIHYFNKEYDLDTYDNVIRTNLNGSVYVSHSLSEDIEKNGGSVINISSVIGYAPVIGRTAYAASKFGMEGFFSVWAAEKPDIHIMMVYPTFIETDIRQGDDKHKTIREILTADVVAEKVFDAFIRKKKKVYIGKTARLSYVLYKYLPRLYVKMMRKKMNIE